MVLVVAERGVSRMRRIILYVSVATITLLLGVMANFGVNKLGDFAVNELWDVEPITEFGTATSFANAKSGSAGTYFCGYLIVSIAKDGDLYLNREETGIIYDPTILTTRLKTIFALREETGAYVPSVDLFSKVPGDLRVDKTVYIKAHRSMTYGEVGDLVRRVKEAGAYPVYLLDPVHLPADRSFQPQ